MPYIKSVSINTERVHPYPYDIPAINFAKDLDLSGSINFIIGENGTGKSTLLETIACRLQLPHMDGSGYSKKSFSAARELVSYLDLQWNIDRPVGFFFRAEDFGDFLNSVERTGNTLGKQMSELYGNVPDHIIESMKNSANYQLHHVRRNFGQELDSFSHGEAYLHIMHQKINRPGVYLLDEPEAALSPSKQLSFMYFLNEHLNQHNSQFIIATHSPMLMAYPNASIYEVTDDSMLKTPLENTDHYSITKSFLNNPTSYFRHLDI